VVRPAGSLAEIGVAEPGPDGLLDRLSDPFWFQCFGRSEKLQALRRMPRFTEAGA
jgi:hypothetical protein